MDIDSYYNKLYTRYQTDLDNTEEKERNAIRRVQEVMEALTLEERADKFFYDISDDNSVLLVSLIERLRGASVSEVLPIVHKLVDLSDEIVYNAVSKEIET